VPIGTRSAGRPLNWAGYRMVRVKTAAGWRYFFEHRLIWSDANGPIPDGTCIHHLNGIKADNRLENLAPCCSNSEHHRRFHQEAAIANGRRVGSLGKGTPKSAEHRAAIAAALRGKTKSSEHCAKLSAALMGRPRPDISARQSGVTKTLTPSQRANLRSKAAGHRDPATGQFS